MTSAYERFGPGVPMDSLTAAAVNHIRLTYEYLNTGDIDAFGSLYASRLLRLVPGEAPILSRDELARFHLDRPAHADTRHFVDELVATGRFVCVRGRATTPGGTGPPTEVPFVDLCCVGADALVTEQRTFYFVPPSRQER